VSNVEELYCTHEEADTIIILHTTNLARSDTRVIIGCDDTDVLVLLLHYYSKGHLDGEVYMHAGHSRKMTTNERYIPVYQLAHKIGQKVCACLPAMHALFRIGKRTAYSTLVQNIDNVSGLETFHTSSGYLQSARTYAVLLYGKKKETCSTLDELRFKLATTTGKPESMLPPSVKMHSSNMFCEQSFKQTSGARATLPSLQLRIQ